MAGVHQVGGEKGRGIGARDALRRVRIAHPVERVAEEIGVEPEDLEERPGARHGTSLSSLIELGSVSSE